MEKQIRQDHVQSVKDKDQNKKTTLSLLLNEINNRKKELKVELLSDDEIVEILKREIKKRNQSIDMFTKSKRTDLVEKEEQELEVLQTYMPEPLTEEQLKWLTMTLKENNPGIIEGKLIGLVNKEVSGLNSIDQVKKIVKEVFNN